MLSTALGRKIWRWETFAGLCLINGFRRGVELGVKTGKFSLYVCRMIPDMEMLCVDMWKQLPPRAVEGAETYADADMEALYANFVREAEQVAGGRIAIARSDTVEAARSVADGSVDIVFVDADHTYEGCLRDIRAWTPKVRPGGMITGHDYHLPTVRRAVDETGGGSVFSDKMWVRHL